MLKIAHWRFEVITGEHLTWAAGVIGTLLILYAIVVLNPSMDKTSRKLLRNKLRRGELSRIWKKTGSSIVRETMALDEEAGVLEKEVYKLSILSSMSLVAGFLLFALAAYFFAF